MNLTWAPTRLGLFSDYYSPLPPHHPDSPSLEFFSSWLTRRRQWYPTPVLLPGKSHGWRSLEGCSPLGLLRVGHEWATSLSRTGEGNGNPLQCSCLENPRDRGAWWAAVSGVAQSRTWLKRLSSSSSIQYYQEYVCLLISFKWMTFNHFSQHF